MPEDELRWIEKYRAALNRSTAKPRGLLEAIARALGLAVGRIARTQRTAKVSAQVPQPENLHRSLRARAGVQISASAQMSTMLLES